MIFRHALRLPKSKKGTVFVKNEDGTLGLDMKKVNDIRTEWGGKPYPETGGTVFQKSEFKPHNDNISEADFLSGDNIVGVGGYTNGKVTVDPKSGERTVIMTDDWDIQPFKDYRTAWKWGSKHLPFIKNFEVINALGGRIPTTNFIINEPNIIFKQF